MEFRVSTPAISSGAQRFNGVAEELLNQIATVGREIGNLREAWTGPAATQFDAIMAEWNHDANDITNLLNQVISRLNVAQTNYSEVESSIQKSFQG